MAKPIFTQRGQKSTQNLPTLISQLCRSCIPNLSCIL